MSRHLFLAAGLVLLASAATAQEKAGGLEKGQQSEPKGHVVRDAPEALRVQDMTMEELQQRLTEYEAGKRDDRDGYIILNQLWFNYQAQSRTSSPDFQAIVSKRDGLLKKRPELGNLQDFDLSDRIRFKKRQKEDEEKKLAKLRAWTPKDTEPKGFFAQGNRVAVKYQYRIEFFALPNYFSFFRTPDSGWMRRDSRSPNAPAVPVDISKNNPTKILSFKNNITVYPRNTMATSSTRLLACTSHRSYYSPTTDEQREAVRAKGYGHGMPWRNEGGERDHFCGVIDLSGNTLYEFPREPGKLLIALDVLDDGARAAVLVGKEVVEHSTEDGRELRVIGDFYEMLIWEYPNILRRVKLNEKNLPDHVWLQKFRKREL